MVGRLCFVLLFWAWSTVALAVSAVLVPSARSLEVGQSIAIELQLVDMRPGSPPSIPTDTGLNIQYQGMSTMHEMINFKSRTIYKLRYVVTGLQEGVWTVGPFRMVHDGRPIEVEPLRLNVEPRSAETANIASVRTELSDSLPFEGETVVYSIQYQFRKNVSNLSLSNPEFTGFESISGIDPIQTEHHIFDDQELIQVRDVTIPLMAKSQGNHQFRPVQLSVDVIDTNIKGRRSRSVFDEFFQQSPSRREQFISEPLTANVRPLPTPPVGFSGLVGTFRLQMSPSQREVKAGETVNIELTLSGVGSLQGYSIPDFEQNGFRSYSDSPQRTSELKDGQLISTLTQNVAIVPDAEGALQIDPIELVIFDTDEEMYMTLRTTPITLQVTKGAVRTEGFQQFSEISGIQVDSDQAPRVQSLGMDIRSVDSNAVVENRTPLGQWHWLALFPVLGLVIGLGNRFLKNRSVPAELSLKNLPKEPSARLSALDTLFRQTIASQLSVDSSALLPDQIDSFDSDAFNLRTALGQARFGGDISPQLDSQIQAFIRRYA